MKNIIFLIITILFINKLLFPDAMTIEKELEWLKAETFVVTASKFRQKFIDAPAKMFVWTKEMIRENGLRNLEEVLEHTPGFYYSFNSDYACYSVRGMNPLAPGLPQPNILFMIDGIRINEATFFGHYYSYFHHLDNVKQIEIILGPGGALYGLNAMSGVVNIITEDANNEKQFEITGNIIYESPLNKSYSFIGLKYNDGNKNKLYASLNISNGLEGKWDTGVNNLGKVDWYEKSPWHNGLKRGSNSLPNWDIKYSYDKFKFFTYRSSIMYSEFNAPWWDIKAERIRSFEKRIYDLSFTPDFYNTELHLNFNQHYDFHESVNGYVLWNTPPAPSDNSFAYTEVNEYLVNAQISPIASDNNRLLFFSEYSYADRKANFLGDDKGRSLDQNRFSLLGQWENKSFENFDILLGLRYDWVNINSKVDSLNDNKLIDYFDAFSPRLSVQYFVNENNRLRLIGAISSRQFILGDFADNEWSKKDDYINDLEFNYYSKINEHFSADINLFYMYAPYASLAIHDNFFPPKGRTTFETYGIESDFEATFLDYFSHLGITYWHAKTGQLKEANIDRMLNVPQIMAKLNFKGPLIRDLIDFSILINGNFNLLHMDDLKKSHKKEWSYFPVNFVLTTNKKLFPYDITLGVKNMFNQKFNYPGYGYIAPFSNWCYPEHMVPDSRLEHQGFSLYFKFGYTL